MNLKQAPANSTVIRPCTALCGHLARATVRKSLSDCKSGRQPPEQGFPPGGVGEDMVAYGKREFEAARCMSFKLPETFLFSRRDAAISGKVNWEQIAERARLVIDEIAPRSGLLVRPSLQDGRLVRFHSLATVAPIREQIFARGVLTPTNLPKSDHVETVSQPPVAPRLSD